MASQFSWSSTAMQTPVLPWTPLHHTTIKQEPMDPTTGFLSNQSEGFHSASPSSSSRDSNSHSPAASPGHQPKTNFSFLTPPGIQVSPRLNMSTSMTMPVADTPPKSPSPSPPWSSNMDVASSSGDSAPEEEVPGLTMPAINSHGKMKKFKCKQCGFIAVTKMSFWEHSKSHIKPERMLTCPQCPFVTEYKHHMEYHVRNHDGSKPFTCPHCPYTCVNKSMLNSHLKSHSSIYQYRCANCTYATKYCHSLKLHLRKYDHNPDVVLNMDGTPNPLPIIDVYGTRRGPKRRTQTKMEDANVTSTQSQQPFFPNHFGVNFPYPPLLHNSMLFQHNNNLNESNIVNKMLESQTKDNLSMMQNLPTHFLLQQNLLNGYNQDISQYANMVPSPTDKSIYARGSEAKTPQENGDALDLTNTKQVTPVVSPSTPKNRRKGKAFKISRNAVPMEEDCEESSVKIEVPQSLSSEQVEEIEVTVDLPKFAYDSSDGNETDKERKSEDADKSFSCEHCELVFKDIVMYTMHMGYHGYNDPFTCNMCGYKSEDKVSFFVHIARSKHS